MAVVPQNIGKYKIDTLLGKGGMGEVYKAHDSNLGRFVALKIMRGPAMDDSLARERFIREAQAAGGLRHPNIVTIYDLGEIDEQLFIAMEFILGEDLEKMIKSKMPLTIEEKLNIMIQVCEGIGYAHKNQIVHRDLKPSNIRIDEQGVVKIMDFGIAKVESSNMTATGTVMGTPYYMSPEQVRGLKVDSRSDIFSLGAILYELFTYRKAFEGEIAAVFYKIVHEQPLPISEFVDVQAEPIQKIIDRCLQKDKAQRIQSCTEMADLLRSALNTYRESNVATVIGIRTSEGGPEFRLPTAPSAVTKSTTGSGTGAPRPAVVEQATEVYGQSTPPPLAATQAEPTALVQPPQPELQPSYSSAAPPIPEVIPETRATKKQSPFLLIVIFAALLGGAGAFYFFYKHSSSQGSTTNPPGPEIPKPGPSLQQPDVTAEITRAKALHQEGKYDAAAEIYSGLIQKYPSDANLHFLLGAAEKKMRKNNEALQEFQKAVALDQKMDQAWQQIGFLLYDRMDYPGAEDAFHKSINYQPASAGSWEGLAQTYLVTQKTAEAEKAYMKLLELEPDNLNGIYNLGQIQLANKDFDKAQQSFEKVLAMNPNHAEAHNNLGAIYLGQGQVPQSILENEKALRLKPELASAHYSLFLAYEQQENFKAAGEHLAKYIELTGDNDAALQEKLKKYSQ